MAEAAGMFSGRAGSRAPSSPCHHVNSTVSLPHAALCTQGSAASLSQPLAPAGGSFAGRHEPAARGQAEEWPPLSTLLGLGAGWRWLLGVPRLPARVAAAPVQICPFLPRVPVPALPMSPASPDWQPSPELRWGVVGAGGSSDIAVPSSEGCPHAAKACVPSSQPGTSGMQRCSQPWQHRALISCAFTTPVLSSACPIPTGQLMDPFPKAPVSVPKLSPVPAFSPLWP